MRRLGNRFETSVYFWTGECGKIVMSSLFFCYRRCLIFAFCSESNLRSGPIFCLLARPNYQHSLVLARHSYGETMCMVSQSTILENRCAEAVRMGSQSSISECRHAVTMGMGRNPQFWSSNGAQPEIRQEKRNHAHDFKFLENLKIWSHGGPRSLTHLLRTPARLNRYPRIKKREKIGPDGK